MRHDILMLLLTAAAACALAGPAAAQEAEQPNVFDLPRLLQAQAVEQAKALQLLTSGQHEAAEKILSACVERIPHDFNARYNLACAQARQGKTELALASLRQAVEQGFRNRRQIAADEDLKALRDDPQFQALLELAEQPLSERTGGWKYPLQPARPADAVVEIHEENVAWTPQIGMFRVVVQFAGRTDAPVTKGLGEAGALLRGWQAEGTAAGNHGDLYDNRDGDHSNMNYRALPQLTRVEYSDSAKKRQLHNGLQRFFLFNAVTIGNSSTAVTSGPFWRSQARLALTQNAGADRLHLQYRANQLYFYPEHRDHDPGHNDADGQGYGDVYPVNTPYLIISQGSSGSDRAFMNAVAQTLAAFRPAVKKRLTETGTLMPAVQMILRSSSKLVESPKDYLQGQAHPAVFDGKHLDVVRMVTKAHQLRRGSLPPLVQLKVVEEDESRLGVDYFDTQLRERLCDTPSAIGRVFKTTRYEKRMVVSAEQSLDVNDKPLTYHWKVLRGDANRIRIKRMNEAGSVAELTIPYHTRQQASAGCDIESNRVDIGVFVHNGEHFSAPAFVSYLFLDDQERVYDEQHRIHVVDYTGSGGKRNYVDPLIDLPRDWRDEYRYDDSGQLAGWTRIRGQQREEFTADGRLVLEQGADGRPAKTAEVRYVAQPSGRSAVLVQQIVEP